MDNTSKKKSSLRGCLIAFIYGLGFLTIVFLYFNWGIWRSESYELTGLEFPLKTVYKADLSGRGREAGYFIVVYELPENIQQHITERRINLSEYPMFSAGFERDGYKRINWTHDFPRNDIENDIFKCFQQDVGETSMPTLDEVVDGTSAECLANHLLRDPGTVCGGWYKRIEQNSSESIWIPRFYFYVMNPEKRVLIMFGMDT